MNIARLQKRILIFVILPAGVLYCGLRFYAQYRHVDIYISRAAPMPAELAAGLHMEEHKINPAVTIESPYEAATDKILAPAEIRRLRSAIAWGTGMPGLVDSLSIQSPTRVLARRTTSRVMFEYQLIKDGDRWLVEHATRSKLEHGPSQHM